MEAAGIDDLAMLNDRWRAWQEAACNARVDAETGQTPIARILAGGPPPAADPALLTEAFRWATTRVVPTTTTMSLAGLCRVLDYAKPAVGGPRAPFR
ncbi:MAG TPA: hypothetical protein VMW47_04665 [Verrucomicrobiae bacterium]|nr:hypothetical protein [Verrucomicrobiae bacterium]